MQQFSTLFRPMLARPLGREERFPRPLLGSVKLDGVRCIVTPSGPRARSLKQFANRNLATWLDWSLLAGLDGELIAGELNAPDVFHRTSAMLRTYDAPLTDLCFHVFDCVLPRVPYIDRLTTARNLVSHYNDAGKLCLLPHYQYNTPDDARAAAMTHYHAGCEGLILRDPIALYKHGRTSARELGMLKVKPLEHSEAVILSVHPLRVNNNPAMLNELGYQRRSSHADGKVEVEMVGSFLVRDLATGQEFSLGGGSAFTNASRAQLWLERASLPGRVVRYSFQACGTLDAPRQPQFNGFRMEVDL